MLRLLAITGSLRRASSNKAVLEALRRMAPDGIAIELYEGIGDLPLFNPDLDQDGEPVPPPVADLRASLAQADGVLISTPEYAHGLPGVLKNALDWTVSSGEFVDKPVALINASARGTYAIASLTEILTVMSARLVAEASISLDLPGNQVDADFIVGDRQAAETLRRALAAFRMAIPH